MQNQMKQLKRTHMPIDCFFRLNHPFGIAEYNRAIISRFMREAVNSGLIVVADPSAAPKLMSYLPFWAAKRKGDQE